MRKLLFTIAAVALVGSPLAAQAQNRDGRPGDGYQAGVAAGCGDGGCYPRGDPRPGDYGADDAYLYPDEHGAFRPFAYVYSAPDDAYVVGGAAYHRYDSAPNVGWSAGGAPVDCGRWIWRESRGAYQWAPAPCPR